jgi:hypothetical protein
MLTYIKHAWEAAGQGEPDVDITGASEGDVLFCAKTDDERGTGSHFDIAGGEPRIELAETMDAGGPDPNSRVNVYRLGSGGTLHIDAGASMNILIAILLSPDYPIETVTIVRLLERETPSQTSPSYTPYVNLVAGDLILCQSTVAQGCGKIGGMENHSKIAGTAAVTRHAHELAWTNNGISPRYYSFGSDFYLVTTGGTFSYCGFSVHIFRFRSTVLKQYTIADSQWTLG